MCIRNETNVYRQLYYVYDYDTAKNQNLAIRATQKLIKFPTAEILLSNWSLVNSFSNNAYDLVPNSDSQLVQIAQSDFTRLSTPTLLRRADAYKLLFDEMVSKSNYNDVISALKSGLNLFGK